jgi:hypothetical protein
MSIPGGPPNGLAERFTAFPVPQETFDPSKATPEELVRFGLPPQPDAYAQPQLREAWDRAFGQPIQLLPFMLERDLQSLVRFRLQPRRLQVQRTTRTRFEASSNWSGAYVTANDGRGFVQVWGMWTVPDGLKAPPPPFEGDPGMDYKVATWIGLDGQRRYFDASLPQIGTTSILQPDGARRAEAWVQWWARDELGLQLVVLPLAVEPGQTVLCVVTVLGPQEVACVAVNLSASPVTAQAVSIIPPLAPLPGGGTARPSITGATAEWVVERPRDVNADRFENFPDYGQTRFDFCYAVAGESPDLGSVFDGTVTGLQGARDIRMFEMLTGPARTEYISMPKKMDNATLRVRYGGFR